MTEQHGTELATPDELTARMTYAKALAASDLLPTAYRKQPANVLVAIEYGYALGLAPMVAIQQIAVVSGKPTMSAQLMGALVRQAGHRLRVVSDEAGTAVEAQLTRSDDPEFTFTARWDMQRAKAAGLVGKGGSWSQYPLAMLKARAITEVCRDAVPEVLAGVAYTPEELDAPAHSTGPVSAPVVTATHLLDNTHSNAGHNAESQTELVEVDPATGVIIEAEVVEDTDQ